jgi:hypothetical protein
MNRVYLSICVIVRDEAPYITEWIEFCRLTGVQRFYIYLDYPRDNTEQVLRELDRGDIVITHWTDDQYQKYRSPVNCTFAATPQITSFNHWIKTHATETEWVAFIDPDEFMYHAHEDDLRSALRAIPEETSAVWVQWLIFGRNGHGKKPVGLTIMSYTRRGRPGYPKWYGNHGKIIARSDRLDYFGPHGSHNAIFKTGGTVNEKGHAVLTGAHPAYPRLLHRVKMRVQQKFSTVSRSLAFPTADVWRCNHYYNRSEEEAHQKLARGDRNAVGKYIPDLKRLNVHDVNDVEDREIWRFLPALQQKLSQQILLPEITKGAKVMKTGLAFTQLLSFEIGRACNLAQAHAYACPSADVNRYGRLDISRELSDDVIVACVLAARDMGFAGQVAFHYYNEPMLSWDRIKALIPLILTTVPEAKFCLWTNGTVLPDPISELSVFSSIWVSNYASRDWKQILAPTGAEIHIQDGRLDGRKEMRERADHSHCLRPYNEMVVDVYGNCHLCCADWRGEVHVGNVLKDSFQTVADNFVALRETLSRNPVAKDAPAYCLLCSLKMRDVFELVPAVAKEIKKHLDYR